VNNSYREPFLLISKLDHVSCDCLQYDTYVRAIDVFSYSHVYNIFYSHEGYVFYYNYVKCIIGPRISVLFETLFKVNCWT